MQAIPKSLVPTPFLSTADILSPRYDPVASSCYVPPKPCAEADSLQGLIGSRELKIRRSLWRRWTISASHLCGFENPQGWDKNSETALKRNDS